MPKVFIVMPHNFDVDCDAAIGFFAMATQNPNHQLSMAGSSMLCHTFNSLWCEALNARRSQEAAEPGSGITHFAMLHSDVAPSPLWIDVLIDELERNRADVVSAPCRMKNNSDEVNAAISAKEPNGWNWERRLNMKELGKMPDTFDAKAFGFHDRHMLVNTGCWVCRFTDPWVTEKNENGELKFRFHVRNRIVQGEDGIYRSEFWPEDWMASDDWAAMGLKVMVSKKVHTQHMGRGVWRT